MLTAEMLTRLWPHANHDMVEAIADSAPSTFANFRLTTFAELRDFMAQISEETGAGTVVAENLNYSATRLRQVWPSVFTSIAIAERFAGNPRLLADFVYGGRGGNRPDTDDGWLYRGRGLMETTFHDNYAMTARLTGLDCVAHPDLVSVNKNLLACACAFWKNGNLNTLADGGDFRLETIRLNGGLVNYDTRLKWRTIWSHELGLATPSLESVAAPLAASVVGSALWTQKLLNAIPGLPHVAEDNVWGKETRAAVTLFQKAHGLDPDGLVGPNTEAALLAA